MNGVAGCGESKYARPVNGEKREQCGGQNKSACRGEKNRAFPECKEKRGFRDEERGCVCDESDGRQFGEAREKIHCGAGSEFRGDAGGAAQRQSPF